MNISKIKLSIIALLLSTSASAVIAQDSQDGEDTNINSVTDRTISNQNTMNWDSEDNYWRSNYRSRPYYNNNIDYTNVQPAYRYGFESYTRFSGRPYNEVESDLKSGWDKARGNTGMYWSDVSGAVKDSYERLSTGIPSNSNSSTSGNNNYNTNTGIKTNGTVSTSTSSGTM